MVLPALIDEAQHSTGDAVCRDGGSLACEHSLSQLVDLCAAKGDLTRQQLAEKHTEGIYIH